MTVCIGILCDNKNSVIAVTDKMVTGGNIEFEHSKPKYEKITNQCIVMTAGSALDHVELLDLTRRHVADVENPDFASIIEIMKKTYVFLRKRKIEEMVFLPRGLTFDEFYQNMNAFPQGFASNIDSYIDNTDYGVTLLVCGVDHSGGHVSIIHDPGLEKKFDAIGFSAIGIGRAHAEVSLISNKCFQETPLKRAAYYAMEAKISAEVAPGVGKETNLVAITSDGIIEYSESHIDVLKSIYNDKIYPSSMEELLARVDSLE